MGFQNRGQKEKLNCGGLSHINWNEKKNLLKATVRIILLVMFYKQGKS